MGYRADAVANGKEAITTLERVGAGKELARAPDVYSELKDAFEQAHDFLRAHLRSLEFLAQKGLRENRKDPLSGI